MYYYVKFIDLDNDRITKFIICQKDKIEKLTSQGIKINVLMESNNYSKVVEEAKKLIFQHKF